MNKPLRVAAALMCVGLAAACVRTTEGTVAMTTQPGAPLDSSRSTTSPGVAPSDAMTMSCGEFIDLDAEDRLAVVDEILATGASVFGPLGQEFASSMAHTMCQFLPGSTVYEILMGAPPP